MAARVGPTARKIELGIELRRLRLAAGLTIEEAVAGLGFSDTKLQRVETGQIPLRQSGDLRLLLERYGISDEQDIKNLLDMHRDSASQEWWTPYKNYMPSGMPNFVGIESTARATRAYHPTVILGLLQTARYARALFELAKPIEETTTEFIQSGVQLRMERKEALTREDSPVRLWAILGEGALRYVVGDTEVMCEQYRELAALAALENVTVQVLPASTRGYRTSSDFTILDLGNSLPAMVQTDTAWGAVSVSDKPREVGRFSRRFDAMAASAAPPEDTPAFLHRLAREIEKSSTPT